MPRRARARAAARRPARREQLPRCPFVVGVNHPACRSPKYFFLQVKVGGKGKNVTKGLCYASSKTLNAAMRALAFVMHCRLPRG